MKRFCTVLVSAGLVGSALATDVFTNLGDFTAATSGPLYSNPFTGVPAGVVPFGGLDFGPVSGFSYNIDAFNQLFNPPTGDYISTNTANDDIIITFTGNPVTAVGGNFWVTDINFNVIPGDVIINLSDGTSETFPSTSASTFRGYVSDVAISSVLVNVTATGGGFGWATMDNLVVGTGAVGAPCPADLNGDNVVDQLDLNLLLACFNSCPGGDIDGDNDTDQLDLNILLASFNTTCP